MVNEPDALQSSDLIAVGLASAAPMPGAGWASRLLGGTVTIAVLCGSVSVAAQQPSDPTARAVAFLSREVPRWPADNGCYSCHNNGDAARALFAAVRLGYQVPPEALRDTTSWLEQPDDWDENALGESFSDTVLARIQFSGALVSALDAGASTARASLDRAVALVARDQRPDGSWRLDSSGSIGSPATYGTALATWAALRSLRASGASEISDAIERGDRWLRGVEVKTVLDAAAVVLSLGVDSDERAGTQRQQCLQLITDGQAPAGGWGPYVTSAAEPFDTALVLLALGSLKDAPALAHPVFEGEQLARAMTDGRAFLLREQLDDGSWVETTRPPGQRSYAQYISTTGWATLALLATQ